MCQLNYLTPEITLKNNSCKMDLCVGVALLKQWKQGNICLVKPKKDLYYRGFFYAKKISLYLRNY